LMIVVVIIGLLAAVAVPAFAMYIRRAKTAEPRTGLSQMITGLRALATDYQSGATPFMDMFNQPPMKFGGGGPLGGGPLGFGVAYTKPATPSFGSCCSQGGKCAPDASLWDDQDWTALKFSMPEPHYYSYNFMASRASFIAQAWGDLDC